ncbi:TRAP transporter substrate-binding protein [Bradyrhizobium diazoefficiens]|nr:TRAP transporter substrate-binding protein [Bradyrhizobium diazoefficiens]
MTSVTRVASATILAGVMAFAMATSASAQKKYTFGYDQPHSTAYGVAGDMFNAKLMELSKGTMGIDQFPGAQLGQEPVMLQKIRTGDIDFIITSTANAASVAPQAGIFSEHFIFRDKGHLSRVLADQAVTKEFKAMIADSVKGAHVLALMTMGLRNMYSKFPINSVADVKGKKIRVQATMTEDTFMPAYGLQPVHMPFGEVYTSLQTGVVDIAENGVNVYMANKHYEVAPILNITEHEANNNCIWVSDKVWNSLSDEQKAWVEAAAAEVSQREPALALKLEEESAAKLKKLGVAVNEKVNKDGFMDDAKPIQDSISKQLGPHAVKLLELVRAVK